LFSQRDSSNIYYACEILEAELIQFPIVRQVAGEGEQSLASTSVHVYCEWGDSASQRAKRTWHATSLPHHPTPRSALPSERLPVAVAHSCTDAGQVPLPLIVPLAQPVHAHAPAYPTTTPTPPWRRPASKGRRPPPATLLHSPVSYWRLPPLPLRTPHTHTHPAFPAVAQLCRHHVRDGYSWNSGGCKRGSSSYGSLRRRAGHGGRGARPQEGQVPQT